MGRPLEPVRLDEYRPLREIVFDTLRQAIISGDLAPGERLMEVQLAEELGVSRTPVREAIRQLEQEGLVELVPRKGAYVTDISMSDLADVFEIRYALEGLAARLAAERATEEQIRELEDLLEKIDETIEAGDFRRVVELDTQFHELLYAASGNQQLQGILSQLRKQVHRFRLQSLAKPGRMAIALKEHRAIVDAVARRELQAAKERSQEHIQSAAQAYMKAGDSR